MQGEEEGTRARRPVGEGGAILVLFLRSVFFQCLHAFIYLYVAWWGVAFLHPVIESSIFSLPHLLTYSKSIYSSPTMCQIVSQIPVYADE